MPNVGPWEIILLLLLALLLFGAKRLPEIGRSMGRGMREFKDSVSGKDRDDDEPAELPMQTTDVTQTTDATIAARERERDPA
jgi:sec-independent protein translocase protein TatA